MIAKTQNQRTSFLGQNYQTWGTLAIGCIWNAMWNLTGLFMRVLWKHGLGITITIRLICNHSNNCTTVSITWPSVPLPLQTHFSFLLQLGNSPCTIWGQSPSKSILDTPPAFSKAWLFHLSVASTLCYISTRSLSSNFKYASPPSILPPSLALQFLLDSQHLQTPPPVNLLGRVVLTVLHFLTSQRTSFPNTLLK